MTHYRFDGSGDFATYIRQCHGSESAREARMTGTAPTTAAAKKRACRPRTASRHLDQFYTRPAVARQCVARAEAVIGPSDAATLWVEPAAGDGAFLDALPHPRVGVDVAPAAEGVIEADFLGWQPEGLARRVVAIGNPPFGKNSSLAIKFFNHAACFADYIAFIVPRTFEKDSTKRKLAAHMELVSEERLGSECFTLDGAPCDVPTVFQVWRRTGDLRPCKGKATRHPDFEFLTVPGEADFAFQRVGARAGLVSLEGLRKSPQSHYFIRVRNHALDVMGLLQGIDWSAVKHRTAGNPSIGKGELIAEYQRAAQ
jgi:hypothetical protein